MRTFAKWFLVVEASLLILGSVLDNGFLMGLFVILLILGPTVGLGMVFESNPTGNIREVENTGLWLFSIAVCVAIWLFLLVVKLLWPLGGSMEYSAIFYGLSFLLFLVGALCFYYARSNLVEWLRIRNAMGAACPSCGSRSHREWDVCRKCGAVVVWVPNW